MGVTNFLDGLVDATEGFLAYLSKYMVGKDLANYCQLATAIGLTDEDIRRNPALTDPYTLVTHEGSLLTVFDVQGTYQILSEKEFGKLIENLRIRMNGYMREKGHSLTFSFERDPDRALDELMRLAEPQINAARRMGINTEDLILDRVKRNAPLVAWEQNLLVVYTHPSVIGVDLGRELKESQANSKKYELPFIEFGQSPATVLMSLKYRHDTMIESVKKDFDSCGADGRPGILLKQLSAHEATKRVRIMVNRENTSQKFRPVLPGDRFLPHGREDEHDFSDLTPPSVNFQIVTEDVTTKYSLIQTGELWHGNIAMELGPQEPQLFTSLFNTVGREVPWRMRIDLSPGGLSETRGRQVMVGFVGMIGSNSQIRQSFLDLEERSKIDAICSMKITASTWSTSESETKRRMAALSKAVQAWGICGVTSVHGDPLAAWASTIPAFTDKNPANRMVPPLPEALMMMPFQRPATPWAEGGSLVVRTPDGKIYTIQLGSSLQDTWIEVLSAPPGSGKSVLLNTMNSATVHRAGNTRLPLMTIVDVGPSSSGLIDLIRDSLPDNRKNEAIYMRLQNTKEFAVNPGDTQLGARYLTSREREFLSDFLTLFCTNAKERAAPSACSGVIDKIIDIAYEARATNAALGYEENIEDVVDRVLRESGLRAKHDETWWLAATWWEVTDMLFAAGFIREASLANRQAVPVFTDFGAYLNNESVRQLYGTASTPEGEPILAYMARCFSEASSKYALFTGRTKFEISAETRIISIDLNDVIGAQTPEGSLKTAIMYMFARQMAAKNYFLREEVLIPVLPPMYHEYHRNRIADVQDEKKVIAYDEFHNTNGQDAFVQTCIKDAREGRKWGIRVVLVSQYLSDFPAALLNAATAVYVMRGGNTADEDVLRSVFQVSEQAILRLQREATGPDPRLGGNFLALFKTKVGYIVQLLTNTVGPIELWAFSTTLEDVSLRRRLYAKLGNYVARKLLAEKFPTGSAQVTIEHMRTQAGEDDQESVVNTLANRLASSYLEKQANELGIDL
ncbi:hypothetical protein [Pseudomonas sp. AB12(2023)]|uniref:hypothetical protein n=1 Tax=Pseudomonas sp. AB12(2023) TaxID=3048597 RepID=UPI002B23091F|nr:hypothetical protein [Pseudomonas sp. AB12(2023)]MEB0221339.1 hypothetical protein [Pseudomonas sp. AB12(2023)]